MNGRLRPHRAVERALSPAEQRAERLAAALDGPVTVAGFLFLVIVVADAATPAGSDAAAVWSVIAWILWALFVVEFAARLVLARSTARFLRRNWWQVIFLLFPFLRFLRAFSRTARVARLGSSSVRSTRTAAATFGSRVVLLATWTVTVTLAGATLLFELDAVRPMPDALHVAALAATAGEPIPELSGWARVVGLALVMWSAIGFAALAGAIGAFFLEQRSVDSAAATSGRAVSHSAAPTTADDRGLSSG